MFLSKVKVGLSLVLVLALLPAAPAEKAKAPALKKYRVRDQNIEAGFVPAKMEIVAGEPIHATLTVKNLSDKPFHFWFGGDYRATGRHDRFKITATDAKGVLLIDPLAWRMNGPGGGIGGCQGSEPGRTHGIEVNLEQYRTFPGPGEYTITCKFDIEAPEGGRFNGKIVRAPVETTWKLTVLPHTAENVRPVLRELVRQTKKASGRAERLKAMIRLTSFGRERAVPELAALAKEADKEQRVAALFALGNLPRASPRSAAKPLHEEDSEAWAASVEAFAAMPIETEVGALLARLSREKSATARCSLLVALGNTHSPRALAPLEQALRDPSPQLRRAAVRGLVLCGGARALQVLERHALEDLPMREAVVVGLVETRRRPLRVEWLLPVMRAGRGFPQRGSSATWAMEMLRANLGKEAVSVLVASLDFPNPSPSAPYNQDLMRGFIAISGAPKVKWHHGPIAAPPPAQVEQNRRTLTELRAWLARHERERRRVPEKVGRLIHQLGSAEFGEREKASRDLEALGAPAFEALLLASVLSEDLETRRRADRVMEALLRRWSSPSLAGR